VWGVWNDAFGCHPPLTVARFAFAGSGPPACPITEVEPNRLLRVDRREQTWPRRRVRVFFRRTYSGDWRSFFQDDQRGRVFARMVLASNLPVDPASVVPNGSGLLLHKPRSLLTKRGSEFQGVCPTVLQIGRFMRRG
jgi:hypothetical protein